MRKVRIPSRSLVAILSGITGMGADPLADIYPSALSPDARALFLRNFREGRMITRISLDRQVDDDDDWIEFEFGDPDAAISAFVAASKPT
jgi:hypothetical protein